MLTRENEPPLPDPIAYFVTWAFYGTWLPGDGRGWIDYGHGWQMPAPMRELEAAAMMTEDACCLDIDERIAVHEQIAETCAHRGWSLHAVNCRTNHCHVVLTAPVKPEQVRSQLKSWCTRKLKTLDAVRNPGRPVRENWWAERGSHRYIFDTISLEAAIIYVRDCQDGSRPS